jgi:hypothetical protein
VVPAATPAHRRCRCCIAAFHPDVGAAATKTATSVEATASCCASRTSRRSRRGACWIAEAESLTPEAGNALLKQLEAPPISAPRHYLLLARARDELLPTLRSRSWAIWLGPAAALPAEAVAAVAAELAAALDAFGTRRCRSSCSPRRRSPGAGG